MLRRIPLIIQHQRLWLIAEVLFCGAELDLYSREELPFIYWYASCVLTVQFGVIRSILSLLEDTYDGTLSTVILEFSTSLSSHSSF